MRKPVVIIAAVATLLLIAWGSGGLAQLSEPALIQARIAEAGLWGPFIFTGLALVMFGLFIMAPAVWAATAVWSLPVAFAYSFIAALLGSVITYAAARQLGQDWGERVPPSIQRWEERLRDHPFSTIFALRILLWANPLIDLFAAVSRVPMRTYLFATIAGLIPTTAFQIMLGVGGITIAGHLPWWAWGLLIAAALAGVLTFRMLRARRAASDPGGAPQ